MLGDTLMYSYGSGICVCVCLWRCRLHAHVSYFFVYFVHATLFVGDSLIESTNNNPFIQNVLMQNGVKQTNASALLKIIQMRVICSVSQLISSIGTDSFLNIYLLYNYKLSKLIIFPNIHDSMANGSLSLSFSLSLYIQQVR